MKKIHSYLWIGLVLIAVHLPGVGFGLTLRVNSIDGGNGHTIALREDGTLWGYGENGAGQLGDGTDVDKFNPTRLSALTNVVSLGSGPSHNLAVKGDGTVWAWGDNGYGKLGDGTTTPRLTPVQVKDPADPTGVLTGVIRVAAASRHSMALKANGTVWTWGYNYSGQLGDGTTSGKNTPVQVKDPADPSGFLTGVSAIAAGDAGYGHSVALKLNGTVWTWGTTDFAVLGRLTSPTPTNVAGQVAGLTNVTAIAAGWEHTLALKADGTVWACGRNLEGQLGDNTTISSTFPPPTAKFFVQVVELTDPSGYLTGVTGIAADGRHSLAIKSNGTSWAWGSNNGGQLCDDTLVNKLTATRMKDPADASGFLNGVDRVGAGDYHSLLTKKEGTAWGCGWNYSGQLGIGNINSPKLTPVKALIPEYSLIYAWGTGYLTPGEIATFLVEYHNITPNTLQDAVVIFHLPRNFDYTASSNGGLYRIDRNQVFWKLGNLAPGAKGLLTLKLEVPWGLPLHQDIIMFVDLAARNIDSSTAVDDYLNYVPLQVIAEIPYTAGEITSLLAADPKLKDLLNYGLGLGYVFDQVALRYEFSDGSSSLVLPLLDPGKPGPVFLRKEGNTLFFEKYEGTAYALFDQNGGYRMDSNDGSFKGWGTWAVAHSQAEDLCTINCLSQNPAWKNYFLNRKKAFKQTSRECITCQQALKENRTDPENCAACARLYVRVNGKKHPEFAQKIGTCIEDCQKNTSTWQCQSGQTMQQCDLHTNDIEEIFFQSRRPHTPCSVRQRISL